MATFPVLMSGAVTQYPTRILISQEVRTLSFLDGSDQRFLNQGRQYRRWQIHLERLNDSEIRKIESFFELQHGEYSVFQFPDPISNQLVPNCRLATSGISADFIGVDKTSTNLWVIETNG
jgi:hypothetical protein